VKLLKIEDVMEQLQISRSTVNRLIKSGQLPYMNIGRSVRFNEKTIEDFCNNLMEATK